MRLSARGFHRTLRVARTLADLDGEAQVRRLHLADVARLTVSITKLRPFLIAEDWRPVALSDKAELRPVVAPKVKQLELFA